jgi:hypothetical protein
MVVAVLLGPLVGVVTQLIAQRVKEKRDQKLWVFSNLMSLRGQALAPEFVRSLNYIDVVFHENEVVRQRWGRLLGHFGSAAYKGPVSVQSGEKTRDLLAELLAEMARDLGYAFDHTSIKENAYYPAGHGELENQLTELRGRTLSLLKGESKLKVEV